LDEMPGLLLDGYVIGITADRRAEEQCEMFRRRGARVVLGPAVRTLSLAAESGLRTTTEAIVAQPPDVLVAHTGIGIRSWFAAAESWGLDDALRCSLRDTHILARGPKGAGAILTAGLPVEWRAPSETLAEVVAKLLTESVAGRRVAVQLDGDAQQLQVEQLRAAGADVIAVRVYEWTRPVDCDPAIRLLDAACAQRLDAVTFTSAAAVANLFALAEEHDRADALRDAFNGPVVAMCVGPVCADAVSALGARPVKPDRARLGAMVHRLTAELGSRSRHLRMAGTDVVLRGTTVVIDGRRESLSEREGEVLALLLARTGAVVSRGEIMRALWSADTDEHALEVTITRLRRRLGPAGRAIRTVVRRGYQLEVD
jgi:uroporphyrinogen-III synthase